MIIVTQRPDAGFRKVLSAIEEQSYPPDHIIIIDSDEEGFKERLLYSHPSAEVYHIDSSKFDAGAARNMGADLSTADIIIFISQDAMPTNGRFIGRIVRSFGDPRVKAVFGRLKADFQAEALDAAELISAFPEINDSFTSENIRIMEGQAHIFTNVCAAYDREYFFETGKFRAPCLMYEASMFAFDTVMNGDKVVYNSRAEVMYYYRNSPARSFKKGFDKGVMAALHPETAGRIRQYVPERQTKNYIDEEGNMMLLIRYSIRKRLEKFGMFFGKRYRFIPGVLCSLMSRDRNFWKYKRYKETSFESSDI